MGPETRHGLDHLEPNVFKLSQWSAHISAHHTTMEHLDKSVTSYPRNVQERYAEKGEIRVNLFQ